MFSHIPSCPGVRRSSDDSSGCSRGSAAYSGCNRHTHTATYTHAPAARRRITAAPLRTMLSMSTADRSRNSQACPPKVPGPFPQGGGRVPVQYTVPSAHSSPHPKRHADQFSRFCRARGCVQQSNRRTRSVRPRVTDSWLQLVVVSAL